MPDPDPADWAVVRAWHVAVNARDVAAARALVSDDVLLGGPKGQARGADLHADWVRDAGIQLLPVAWHAVTGDVGQVVVVEQDATWPWRAGADVDPDDIPEPLRVATVFRMDATGERITAILRFDTLAEAVRAAQGGM